jgi:hypothetical protein
MTRGIGVGEEEESIMITDLPESSSSEETLILGIKRREIDQGRFKISGGANILAVPI